MAIREIPLESVPHYGIIRGSLDNSNYRSMIIDRMVEKPTVDYAREHLGVDDKNGKKKYYATFGQYVLTPEVYDELNKEIRQEQPSEGKEYGLTSALDIVREKFGMNAFVPDGRAFDIGLPESYRQTMWEFCK